MIAVTTSMLMPYTNHLSCWRPTSSQPRYRITSDQPAATSAVTMQASPR